MQLHILFENSHYLAIDKPAGLIVESSPFEKPTIESLVFEYLSQQYRNPYVGIVHRLDRVTSGILLIAKKRSALRHLNEQFRNRTIQKTYLAIVNSKPESAESLLTHWLIKDQKNKKALISDQSVQKAARVELTYHLLKAIEAGYLLKIIPKTGKFHQIRAQLSAIGCPIIGDEKYGSSIPYRHQAIALHAYSLQFVDPKTKEPNFLKAEFKHSL